jgi:ParB family chromosome partitioning protein
MTRKSLGKGLDALIPGAGSLGARTIQEVDIQLIRSNPAQPRLQIDEESIEDLAKSVHAHGILQPIIVRPEGSGFEIIAGERRWRAAKKAGLLTIPVIIEEADEQKRLEIALIENLQREDLNPLDIAKGIRRLMLDFELTQEEISQRLGKKRPTIANILRLLDLPEEIQTMLEKNTITFGHARTLLSLENKEEQIVLVERIIRENLTVRDVENIIRKMNTTISPSMHPDLTPEEKEISHKNEKNDEYAIEEILTQYLATKVKIKKKRITIEYYGIEDLHRIYGLITGKEEPF